MSVLWEVAWNGISERDQHWESTLTGELPRMVSTWLRRRVLSREGQPVWGFIAKSDLQDINAWGEAFCMRSPSGVNRFPCRSWFRAGCWILGKVEEDCWVSEWSRAAWIRCGGSWPYRVRAAPYAVFQRSCVWGRWRQRWWEIGFIQWDWSNQSGFLLSKKGDKNLERENLEWTLWNWNGIGDISINF